MQMSDAPDDRTDVTTAYTYKRKQSQSPSLPVYVEAEVINSRKQYVFLRMISK